MSKSEFGKPKLKKSSDHKWVGGGHAEPKKRPQELKIDSTQPGNLVLRTFNKISELKKPILVDSVRKAELATPREVLKVYELLEAGKKADLELEKLLQKIGNKENGIDQLITMAKNLMRPDMKSKYTDERDLKNDIDIRETANKTESIGNYAFVMYCLSDLIKAHFAAQMENKKLQKPIFDRTVTTVANGLGKISDFMLERQRAVILGTAAVLGGVIFQGAQSGNLQETYQPAQNLLSPVEQIGQRKGETAMGKFENKKMAGIISNEIRNGDLKDSNPASILEYFKNELEVYGRVMPAESIINYLEIVKFYGGNFSIEEVIKLKINLIQELSRNSNKNSIIKETEGDIQKLRNYINNQQYSEQDPSTLPNIGIYNSEIEKQKSDSKILSELREKLLKANTDKEISEVIKEVNGGPLNGRYPGGVSNYWDKLVPEYNPGLPEVKIPPKDYDKSIVPAPVSAPSVPTMTAPSVQTMPAPIKPTP